MFVSSVVLESYIQEWQLTRNLQGSNEIHLVPIRARCSLSLFFRLKTSEH